MWLTGDCFVKGVLGDRISLPYRNSVGQCFDHIISFVFKEKSNQIQCYGCLEYFVLLTAHTQPCMKDLCCLTDFVRVKHCPKFHNKTYVRCQLCRNKDLSYIHYGTVIFMVIHQFARGSRLSNIICKQCNTVTFCSLQRSTLPSWAPFTNMEWFGSQHG